MTNGEMFEDEIKKLIEEKGEIDCDKCPANSICIKNGRISCALSFLEWERTEYKPKTKKHTLQEWANFTGRFPEEDKSGRAWLFKERPALYPDTGMWGPIKDTPIEITDMVSDADTHQWDILVSPEWKNG